MKKLILSLMVISMPIQAAIIDDLLLEFVRDDQDFLFNKRGILDDRNVYQKNVSKLDLKKLIKKYKTTENNNSRNELWRSIITEAALPDSNAVLIGFIESHSDFFPKLDQDVISAVARIAGLHSFSLYGKGQLKDAIRFLKEMYNQDPRFAKDSGFVKNYSILSYMNGDMQSSIDIVEKFNQSAFELDDSIQTILSKAKEAKRKAEATKGTIRHRF